LQLDPVGRRQRLQNFSLIFRFEIFQDADGIVAFEFADAFATVSFGSSARISSRI